MKLISKINQEDYIYVEVFLFDSKKNKIITEQKKHDESGKTALMHAVIKGRLDIIELLCQKGKIDIEVFNTQDENGMTAVMHAAKSGNENILKFFYDVSGKLTDDLYKQNFSYTATNKLSGYNALMLAIINKHINCLEYLYCKEIQYIINHQDKDGKTPLMLAFDAIAIEKSLKNKENVKECKCVLDKLLRVTKIIFNKRNKRYLNTQFNNKLDLTIQDEEKQNIFKYAEDAGCQEELLDFITSLSISQIIPDLSIRKSLGQQNTSIRIETLENLQGNWSITKGYEVTIIDKKSIQKSRAYKRSAPEKNNNHDTKQAKIENLTIQKNSKKKIKVRLNKPDGIVTEVQMHQGRLNNSGIKDTQFCIRLKDLGLNEVNQSISNKREVISPFKRYTKASGTLLQYDKLKLHISDAITTGVCNGTKNKKSIPNSKLIAFHPKIPQDVQKACILASQFSNCCERSSVK